MVNWHVAVHRENREKIAHFGVMEWHSHLEYHAAIIDQWRNVKSRTKSRRLLRGCHQI